ncbi:LacI family DNA-binding transcriptional regulator [Occultella gossypii]|uniref:LacI family DNA-binding transcriptional regulator n=1 Tax=Occultella gossypii TaxID=2800820 RepID=A0ABS7SAF5_9MICO|nr:LacI family DNA-binding transcriptional regulator [Occultella gossypii]MBZ2196659.1 LacI family DNA-binding transcriptional regulator [Occultella gossypii]
MTEDGDREAGQEEKRSATIYDVARRAGVSHQTVARFLNGEGGIRPYNKVKVVAALEELRYRPNMAARSLATKRTFRIGALGFEIAGHNPGRVLQAASDAARELGYVVEVVGLDPLDPGQLADGVETLIRNGVEGLLITSPTVGIADELSRLRIDIPVLVDGARETDELQRRGTLLALEHLHALGHRRIAHIAGPSQWTAAHLRRATYESFLAERAGAPVVWEGDWESRSGYAHAERVAGDRSITAVFAANDRIALGALLRFHELGIRVPGDVSVVGFDDMPESEFFHPPLTTVRQHFDAGGRTSAARLIAMIEGRSVDAPYPEPELIVRASTGPVST